MNTLRYMNLLFLFFILLLGGCGQKGPLYLPTPPERAKATTP